jgi:uncharacterized protein (DUF302 family)
MTYKHTLAGIALVAAMSAVSPLATAGEPAETIKTVAGSFDEVFADLQDAVINRGLVIDYVGDVGKMLERTADAASQSAGAPPLLHARYLQFCSAAITHEAIAADVQNLAMCPYVVFAYETRADPGKIAVGYRQVELAAASPSQAAQTKVHELLQAVVNETTRASQ